VGSPNQYGDTKAGRNSERVANSERTLAGGDKRERAARPKTLKRKPILSDCGRAERLAKEHRAVGRKARRDAR
jgi:hypothetical protein